jgi:hypothetical protein
LNLKGPGILWYRGGQKREGICRNGEEKHGDDVNELRVCQRSPGNGREIVETDEEYRRRMRNQQAAWKVIRMDDQV